MPTNCTARLKAQDWLKLISNLAIPLIIGIFTIFISIHQQNLGQSNRDKDLALAIQQRQENIEQARLQREEDKKIAQIQRDEDKNMSQLQRSEDKELARLQREEDEKTADLQRENDKELARLRRDEDREIAHLQRQVEYQMSIDKRLQESELAQKQRQLYESQRQHELDILQQNYFNDFQLNDDQEKEQILINYQRQLTKLTLDYQIMSNLNNSNLHFVLQMRTRTALRLLDPQRRTILIQILYRGTFLDTTWKDRKSLLYRTNLTGVQFGLSLDRIFSKYLVLHEYLDIQHADARYAKFNLVTFEASPSFKYSNFDYTDWSFAELLDMSFSNQITMNHARFYQSYIKRLNFTQISMNYVSFESNNVCRLCIFNGTSMINANLFNSTFQSTEFFSVIMTNVNMSQSYFFDTIFRNVILDFADFSHAIFISTKFENVSMLNCLMLNITRIDTIFVNVNDKDCKYDEYSDEYIA